MELYAFFILIMHQCFALLINCFSRAVQKIYSKRRSGVPLVIMRLDLTSEVVRTADAIVQMAKVGDQAGNLLRDSMNVNFKTHHENYDLTSNSMHDVTYIGCLINHNEIKYNIYGFCGYHALVNDIIGGADELLGFNQSCLLGTLTPLA